MFSAQVPRSMLKCSTEKAGVQHVAVHEGLCWLEKEFRWFKVGKRQRRWKRKKPYKGVQTREEGQRTQCLANRTGRNKEEYT